MLVQKCNHPLAPFGIPAAGAGSRRSGPSLNSLIRSIPSWLITPRRSFVLRRVGSNFKRMDRSEALLAPKSFFSVVPFAQSSAYSMSRWHSWRRLGGGGVAQGPYDVARGETLQDARKPMHTDPQSLVDVWSRRNEILGIPPKWLIFLRSLGDSNLCFRRERANCIG